MHKDILDVIDKVRLAPAWERCFDDAFWRGLCRSVVQGPQCKFSYVGVFCTFGEYSLGPCPGVAVIRVSFDKKNR